MKAIATLILVLTLSFSPDLLGQDLSKSRVAIVGLTGGINDDLLDGLDPRNINTIPYTPEEEDLQQRINNRLTKLFLDDVYDIITKRMEEKGIQLEPLSTSDKVARLNENGYPNPLIPKNVIKKKNEDYADYFLNINVICTRPILGGLLGFKPESKIRMVVYDATGKKLQTINQEVKDDALLRDTDFDEEWTSRVERFNRMDWYSIDLLEERLLPIINEVIIRGIEEL